MKHLTELQAIRLYGKECRNQKFTFTEYSSLEFKWVYENSNIRVEVMDGGAPDIIEDYDFNITDIFQDCVVIFDELKIHYNSFSILNKKNDKTFYWTDL